MSKMSKKTDKLRAKCFILFPLIEIANKREIIDKIKEINEILDSMLFTKMEKIGLEFALNQINK